MEQLKMNTLFCYCNPNDLSEYFTNVVYNGRIFSEYYVSNKGRVWSVRWNRFLSQSKDKDGYPRVSLSIDGKSKTFKTHRLVLMAFKPIKDPDNYIGNHCDGVVYHNEDTNLEWTTVMGNTRHGWDTGLNKNKGEGNVCTVVSDEQVHGICKLLEQGYRANEICNHYGITDKVERMRFSAIVSSIAKFKTHRDISRQYNIPGSDGVDRYDESFAHIVCRFLYDPDTSYSNEEIMDYLQIPAKDRPKFLVYLSDIRRGRTAKEISKLYKNQ